jgi:ferredoxin
VVIDEQTCAGSGTCTAIAPAHFRLDGVTSEPVSPEIEPAPDVLTAAESCPMAAIAVYAANGTQLAPS